MVATLFDTLRLMVTGKKRAFEKKHSAVSAQLVHLVSVVRCVVCDVLVGPLHGGRERSRREVAGIIKRDAEWPFDGNIKIKAGNVYLVLKRSDPRRVEQVELLRLRNVVTPNVGDVTSPTSPTLMSSRF